MQHNVGAGNWKLYWMLAITKNEILNSTVNFALTVMTVKQYNPNDPNGILLLLSSATFYICTSASPITQFWMWKSLLYVRHCEDLSLRILWLLSSLSFLIQRYLWWPLGRLDRTSTSNDSYFCNRKTERQYDDSMNLKTKTLESGLGEFKRKCLLKMRMTARS